MPLIQISSKIIQKALVGLCILLITNQAKAQVNSYADSQVAKLKRALLDYQQMNQWNIISKHTLLNKGDRNPSVVLVKKHLELTGDLKKQSDTITDQTLFTQELKEALIKFQSRHGLKEDGVLGSNTIEALNISLTSRQDQLKQAITKWQHFSETNAQTFVLVNIPDFTLNIIEEGMLVQRMKVMVGKKDHPTPLLNAELSHIIIHPTWEIPHSIAIHEILPLLKTNYSYLTQNHIAVYTYKKRKKEFINGNKINWNTVNETNFNYQLEQLPGPWNPLGDIKFILPNPYQVYIHDNPNKELFNFNQRTFSHGCIRLQNPEDLAAWLLKKSNDEITELLEDSQDDTFLPIAVPVCIFFEYFTCWVDEEGVLQFREDIYEWNK